ncbi:uncharacterized protein BDZ99DRAFT_553863 [Mytilinidion resinicola]|uniref:PiggyBac transposable element-derived protein domain-containing protein n=1 Tax=Mytilinidion resinicola TaxID=574789 RepID=A0A6A6YZI5_9PEZI|nr:uncharacterized protein BDZ99DRAFT_553863 [Mytilinidion resinicola]KAF2813863.1 hypothetical protein BDZ99DRAFT_553863 [Mytilinidion resinicola]
MHWTPGPHLTVDETIQRFIGRASEIVNIPTKPTPEGFKIWVLANQGYVLDWLWHAKGDGNGPVDLDESFLSKGFTKTQAVVLDLLTQRDPITNQRIYLPGKHIVWLDNLFSSVKLFERLRELEIGAAGTVRTTKTKREEMEGEECNIIEEPAAAAATQLRTKKRVKVPAESFNRSLMDLKLTHDKQIEWGELYGALSESHKVIEFAWKDAVTVLFLSTVHEGKAYIQKLRKRPAKTASGYRQTVKNFGNEATAWLEIPVFIDEYNLWMCGVDIADQLRSCYSTNRVHRKTWKPLFSFLFDTAVGNSYMLSSYRRDPGSNDRQLRQDSHLQFCRDLRDALLHASVRTQQQKQAYKANSFMDITWRPVREHLHEKLWQKQQPFCAACTRGKRSTATPHLALEAQRERKGWKRRHRPPRTSYGCSVCRIPLCTRGKCWAEHVAALNTKQ